MKSFKTSVVIEAMPGRVWDLLVDVGSWPRWEATTERVEGAVALGSRLRVFSKAAPGRAFRVKVSALSAGSLMVWTGGMPLGLFTGTRTFSISRVGAARTQFDMSERFTGPLVPLIGRAIPDLQPMFDAFAQGLKAAAEKP